DVLLDGLLGCWLCCWLGFDWVAGGAGTCGCSGGGCVGEWCVSGSRISALSPLPNAFLGICDNLLGKLDIAFGALTMYVVEHYRHAVAGRFSQADIARNDGLKDLRTKKAAKIRGNLTGKRSAVV